MKPAPSLTQTLAVLLALLLQEHAPSVTLTMVTIWTPTISASYVLVPLELAQPTVLNALALQELVPNVLVDTMCLVALVLNATLILPMLVVQLVPPKELIPHVRPIIT